MSGKPHTVLPIGHQQRTSDPHVVRTIYMPNANVEVLKRYLLVSLSLSLALSLAYSLTVLFNLLLVRALTFSCSLIDSLRTQLDEQVCTDLSLKRNVVCTELITNVRYDVVILICWRQKGLARDRYQALMEDRRIKDEEMTARDEKHKRDLAGVF